MKCIEAHLRYRRKKKFLFFSFCVTLSLVSILVVLCCAGFLLWSEGEDEKKI